MHSPWRRYYKSVERRGKEMDMFPPGRVIFVRPLKTLVGRRHRAGPKRFEKGWDAVWITPQELIAEGILISGRVRCLSPLVLHKGVSERRGAYVVTNLPLDEY